MTCCVKKVGKLSVKVTDINDMKTHGHSVISNSDAEMDRRAVAAVRSAIDKAKVCNKPVAKYDIKSKRAFMEYADGTIQYVD